jgi:hypothetical protein
MGFVISGSRMITWVESQRLSQIQGVESQRLSQIQGVESQRLSQIQGAESQEDTIAFVAPFEDILFVVTMKWEILVLEIETLDEIMVFHSSKVFEILPYRNNDRNLLVFGDTVIRNINIDKREEYFISNTPTITSFTPFFGRYLLRGNKEFFLFDPGDPGEMDRINVYKYYCSFVTTDTGLIAATPRSLDLFDPSVELQRVFRTLSPIKQVLRYFDAIVLVTNDVIEIFEYTAIREKLRLRYHRFFDTPLQQVEVYGNRIYYESDGIVHWLLPHLRDLSRPSAILDIANSKEIVPVDGRAPVPEEEYKQLCRIIDDILSQGGHGVHAIIRSQESFREKQVRELLVSEFPRQIIFQEYPLLVTRNGIRQVHPYDFMIKYSGVCYLIEYDGLQHFDERGVDKDIDFTCEALAQGYSMIRLMASSLRDARTRDVLRQIICSGEEGLFFFGREYSAHFEEMRCEYQRTIKLISF